MVYSAKCLIEGIRGMIARFQGDVRHAFVRSAQQLCRMSEAEILQICRERDAELLFEKGVPSSFVRQNSIIAPSSAFKKYVFFSALV